MGWMAAEVGKAETTFVPGDSEGGSRWTEFSTHPASKMIAGKKIAVLNTPLFCSTPAMTQDHSAGGAEF